MSAPGSVGPGVWTRVDDESSVGDVRRNATRMAERLGFDQHRTGEVAIAASELASNAQRHGASSSLLLRGCEVDGRALIEIVAIDSGPGMADVTAAMEDGMSTRGTLGIGLGAIQRIANRFEIYSVPAHGTITVAVFAPDAGETVSAGVVDGLTRPITGETACGDNWSWHDSGDAVSLMVADGLGHGLLAAEASQAAVDEFDAGPDRRPEALLAAMHRAMASTRGAAVTVVRFDRERRLLTFAGVGNVACRILDDHRSTSLAPQPGIVGQHLRTVRPHDVDLAAHAVAVLHSDGLTSKWDLAGLPGIRVQSPTVIAAALLREAGLRHDDAGVVVMRTS